MGQVLVWGEELWTRRRDCVDLFDAWLIHLAHGSCRVGIGLMMKMRKEMLDVEQGRRATVSGTLVGFEHADTSAVACAPQDVVS